MLMLYVLMFYVVTSLHVMLMYTCMLVFLFSCQCSMSDSLSCPAHACFVYISWYFHCCEWV